MPTSTVTAKDAVLTLTIGGSDYSCQVIGAEFLPPSSGDGETVPVACGGVVKEPGDPVDGSITGEVYKDLGAGGITRALITARESVVPYVYTEQDSDGIYLTWTGDAYVPVFAVPFTPNKFGRHSLDLRVLTGAPTFGVDQGMRADDSPRAAAAAEAVTVTVTAP